MTEFFWMLLWGKIAVFWLSALPLTLPGGRSSLSARRLHALRLQGQHCLEQNPVTRPGNTGPQHLPREHIGHGCFQGNGFPVSGTVKAGDNDNQSRSYPYNPASPPPHHVWRKNGTASESPWGGRTSVTRSIYVCYTIKQTALLVTQANLNHMLQTFLQCTSKSEWQISTSACTRPESRNSTIYFFYVKYLAKEMAQRLNFTERANSNLSQERGNSRDLEIQSGLSISETNGFYRGETKRILHETSEAQPLHSYRWAMFVSGIASSYV